MLFKLVIRLSVRIIPICLCVILITSTVRNPVSPCTFHRFLDGDITLATYCSDLTLRTLLTKGDWTDPVLIDGLFLSFPQWSALKDKFTYVTRIEWGKHIIYRYYEYDMETGHVTYLYRSSQLYGPAWDASDQLRLVRFDSNAMCFQYYAISGDRLEKTDIDVIPDVTQCAPAGCVTISMRSDICSSKQDP